MYKLTVSRVGHSGSFEVVPPDDSQPWAPFLMTQDGYYVTILWVVSD